MSRFFEEAAAVPLGGLNALHFLTRANIQNEEKVLVNGAGGSRGSCGFRHFRIGESGSKKSESKKPGETERLSRQVSTDRPTASGHRFGPDLACSECGIGWDEHQRNPLPCASKAEAAADVFNRRPPGAAAGAKQSAAAQSCDPPTDGKAAPGVSPAASDKGDPSHED